MAHDRNLTTIEEGSPSDIIQILMTREQFEQLRAIFAPVFSSFSGRSDLYNVSPSVPGQIFVPNATSVLKSVITPSQNRLGGASALESNNLPSESSPSLNNLPVPTSSPVPSNLSFTVSDGSRSSAVNTPHNSCSSSTIMTPSVSTNISTSSFVGEATSILSSLDFNRVHAEITASDVGIGGQVGAEVTSRKRHLELEQTPLKKKRTQIRNALLERSESKNWEDVKKEWRFLYIISPRFAPLPKNPQIVCPCEDRNEILCVLKNETTKNHIALCREGCMSVFRGKPWEKEINKWLENLDQLKKSVNEEKVYGNVEFVGRCYTYGLINQEEGKNFADMSDKDKLVLDKKILTVLSHHHTVCPNCNTRLRPKIKSDPSREVFWKCDSNHYSETCLCTDVCKTENHHF